MDTINNLASTAAKAVWGEGDANKEPVSGVKGDVSKGEPYDAGNLDAEGQEKVESRLSNVGHREEVTKIDSDKPTTTTTAAATPGKPATVGDSTSGQNDTSHPDTDVPETLDPDSIKGPGPKPIDVVAREHGGDAGRNKEPVTDSAVHDITTTSKNTGDDTKAADEGTGEGYIKATGLAADGGNFDATKPGAGHEADRLLEQKSHPTTTDQGSSSTPVNDTSKDSPKSKDSKHGKNKPSLSERIKAKFHKH